MISSDDWDDGGVNNNFAKIDIRGGFRQNDGLAGVGYAPVLESAFGRGGIGRGRGRGGHPMDSAQNGFVGGDYSPYKWFCQPSGNWASKAPGWTEDEDEKERYIPSGDLKNAHKWTDHSLKFDGIYLSSNGQLMFVINDGTQKRVLSYEEAMDTDMRGVCNLLSAKMQQKLAVQQL